MGDSWRGTFVDVSVQRMGSKALWDTKLPPYSVRAGTAFLRGSCRLSAAQADALPRDRRQQVAKPSANKDRIHIFSLASGHLYERLLKVMVQCVAQIWTVSSINGPDHLGFCVYQGDGAGRPRPPQQHR